MMTQIRSALRAVVLPSPDANPQDTPTRRLLGQLGHDVSRATSAHHALELMSSEHTDLLVVDVANNKNREMIDAFLALPTDKRPEQVALFTDAMDPQLSSLRRVAAPSHVHVFLKPLHVHGLLTVLRQLEKDHPVKLHA